MGLGQSKPYQYPWNPDPRFPPQFQQRSQQPFIPAYVPAMYPQQRPVYPQPGFIPPVYGQGAVLPPQQLHYFPQESYRRRKSRRPTPPRRSPSESHQRRQTAVRPDLPSPERNPSRRAPTPFIPPMAEAVEEEDEEEEEEEEEIDRSRNVAAERERPASRQSPIHYEQPPAAVHGDMSVLQPMAPASRGVYGPSGLKPLTPLKNPLPPPPKDLYEMSPYKTLLTLPQTTALLTATYGPQQATVSVAPLDPDGNANRKKSIFRAFSRKDKKNQPEQQKPVFIPVFLGPNSQSQQPSNQPQRSSTQARPVRFPRFQSQRRPFAGSGPRDVPPPTTAEPTTGGLSTEGPYRGDSSSVLSDALSAPIPPHPTNPPTLKFDQYQSYPQFMNHSPHRVVWEGLTYPTAFHLHEALKFLDLRPDIAEQIRTRVNVHDVYPLSAKYVAFQRPDWGDQFLLLVYFVLSIWTGFYLMVLFPFGLLDGRRVVCQI